MNLTTSAIPIACTSDRAGSPKIGTMNQLQRILRTKPVCGDRPATRFYSSSSVGDDSGSSHWANMPDGILPDVPDADEDLKYDPVLQRAFFASDRLSKVDSPLNFMRRPDDTLPDLPAPCSRM